MTMTAATAQRHSRDPEGPGSTLALLLVGFSAGLLLAGAFCVSYYQSRVARAEETAAASRAAEAEMRGRQEGYLAALERMERLERDRERTIVIAPAPAPAPVTPAALPAAPAQAALPAPEATPVPEAAATAPEETAVAVAIPEAAVSETISETAETKAGAGAKIQIASAPEEHTPEADMAAPAPAAVLPAGAEKGRVLSLQARQKRVMIDAGSGDGLTSGMRLGLWRDGAYVGEIRVKSVLRDMSSCEILQASADGIRVGDVARELDGYMTMNPVE